MDPQPSYETFFGFGERPFSLTPDPKYYFRSRSHSRALDALTAGLAQREHLLLVTGDLGVGKTTLGRMFIDVLERKTRAALVGNSLLSPEDLLRILLPGLGAIEKDEVSRGRLAASTRTELQQMLNKFLLDLQSSKDGAVLIIDEAHSLPPATKEQVVEIVALVSNRDRVIQFLLAGQPSLGGASILPPMKDERLMARARLQPLERDECEKYIVHRLAIGGGNAVTFNTEAIEVIYTLSGGVPRLVNLLCERALQEAANAQANRVEPKMIQSAASALDLIRLRPKRFRWYGTR